MRLLISLVFKGDSVYTDCADVDSCDAAFCHLEDIVEEYVVDVGDDVARKHLKASSYLDDEPFFFWENGEYLGA